jgi:ankyrin repeat protein
MLMFERFMLAIKNYDVFLLEELISQGFEINSYVDETSFLCFAIHYGNIEVVRTMVINGADVNYVPETSDMYPLSDAACLDKLEVAKFLIENGANPNQFDIESESFPLLHAAQNGKIEMFNFLREITKADLVEIALEELEKFHKWENQKQSERFPKLIDAIQMSDLSRVKHFIDFEVNTNSFDEYHMTPLMYAVIKPPKSATSKVFKLRYRIIEALLDAGANPNLIGQGISPLITAVDAGDLQSVRLLLKSGADPKVKDKNGSNAISKAQELNHKEILQALSALQVE